MVVNKRSKEYTWAAGHFRSAALILILPSEQEKEEEEEYAEYEEVAPDEEVVNGPLLLY